MRKKVTVPDHWKAYYDEVAAEAADDCECYLIGTLSAILSEDKEHNSLTPEQMLAHARYLLDAYHDELADAIERDHAHLTK